MTKKMVFIIPLLSFSVLLHGMNQLKRKTTGESKSKSQPSEKLTDSAEKDKKSIKDNPSLSLTSSKSGKLSIKSLDDIQRLRSGQNEYRDQSTNLSKSDGMLEKKVTISVEKK